MTEEQMIEEKARLLGLTPTQYSAARMLGLSETQLKMRQAVSNKLMRDIVADSYARPTGPSSIIPTDRNAEPVKHTNGWQDAKPLTPPPGIELVDRLVDAQDAQDKRERARRV